MNHYLDTRLTRIKPVIGAAIYYNGVRAPYSRPWGCVISAVRHNNCYYARLEQDEGFGCEAQTLPYLIELVARFNAALGEHGLIDPSAWLIIASGIAGGDIRSPGYSAIADLRPTLISDDPAWPLRLIS